MIFNNKLKNFKLDNILIKLNGETLKNIILNRNTDISERLNLLGVSFYEKNSTVSTDYSFEYKDFNLLPNYLNKADHWGYNNGTIGNSLDLNYYPTREPNANFLKIGSLSKITYPTKGFVEFEYEPHDYSRFVDENLILVNEVNIAGGIRIKKMKINDGVNEQIKEIKYVNDLSSTISSGILGIKNKYSWPAWQIYSSTNSLYQETNFSINPIIPGSNFSGTHIGYSTVFEINGINNGYTQFDYTDYIDYPDTQGSTLAYTKNSIFSPHNQNDFKRGLEKKISVFNNQYVLQKEINNTYNSSGLVFKTRGFQHNCFFPCALPTSTQPVPNYIVTGNAYEIEYTDFNLTSSITKDYLGSNIINKTTTYSQIIYPNNSSFFGDSFLQSETNLNGFETVTSSYKYPFDYTGTVENQMTSSHYLTPIEKTNEKLGQAVSKNKIILNLQTLNNGVTPPATVPMLTSSQVSKGLQPYETDIIIDLYDRDGNIQQFHKNNGTFTTLIWENNLLKYKIENATYNDFYGIGLSTLRNNINVKIIEYAYDQFRNIATIIYPNGLQEKYIYDVNNRLEKITDSNNVLLKKFEYNIK